MGIKSKGDSNNIIINNTIYYIYIYIYIYNILKFYYLYPINSFYLHLYILISFTCILIQWFISHL